LDKIIYNDFVTVVLFKINIGIKNYIINYKIII